MFVTKRHCTVFCSVGERSPCCLQMCLKHVPVDRLTNKQARATSYNHVQRVALTDRCLGPLLTITAGDYQSYIIGCCGEIDEVRGNFRADQESRAKTASPPESASAAWQEHRWLLLILGGSLKYSGSVLTQPNRGRAVCYGFPMRTFSEN